MMITEICQSGAPTRVCAAINVSPESFHAGSIAAGEADLLRAVQRAEQQGAALLDIGAMSTAPYKEARISEEEETHRMEWAIRLIRPRTTLPISADTQRLQVAKAAIAAGANLINDVSALQISPGIATLCADSGTGLILMASEYGPVMEDGHSPEVVVARLLEEAVGRATSAGVPRERLILDPGIGFFRNRSLPWYEWDLALLKGVDRWRQAGVASFVGASRKSLFAPLLHRKEPADRLAGSLAVAAAMTRAGVEWIRAHDVAETVDVIRMTRLLL